MNTQFILESKTKRHPFHVKHDGANVAGIPLNILVECPSWVVDLLREQITDEYEIKAR